MFSRLANPIRNPSLATSTTRGSAASSNPAFSSSGPSNQAEDSAASDVVSARHMSYILIQCKNYSQAKPIYDELDEKMNDSIESGSEFTLPFMILGMFYTGEDQKFKSPILRKLRTKHSLPSNALGFTITNSHRAHCQNLANAYSDLLKASRRDRLNLRPGAERIKTLSQIVSRYSSSRPSYPED